MNERSNITRATSKAFSISPTQVQLPPTNDLQNGVGQADFSQDSSPMPLDTRERCRNPGARRLTCFHVSLKFSNNPPNDRKAKSSRRVSSCVSRIVPIIFFQGNDPRVRIIITLTAIVCPARRYHGRPARHQASF